MASAGDRREEKGGEGSWSQQVGYGYHCRTWSARPAWCGFGPGAELFFPEEVPDCTFCHNNLRCDHHMPPAVDSPPARSRRHHHDRGGVQPTVSNRRRSRYPADVPPVGTCRRRRKLCQGNTTTNAGAQVLSLSWRHHHRRSPKIMAGARQWALLSISCRLGGPSERRRLGHTGLGRLEEYR